MALIDADWWNVRRKLGGAAGASQVMSGAPAPVYKKRVPYVRMRPSGCNSTTRRQVDQRARWGYVTWAWGHVLTEIERYRWNEYADVEWSSWRDEEQQYRELNGFQWFCGLSGRVLRAGLPLNRDAREVSRGFEVEVLDFEFVSQSRIRVTFWPDDWYIAGLVVYGRGPVSSGVHAVVPEINWWRHSVPSRWYWIGFGGEMVPSPIEFDLPHVVPVGRKLAIMAGLMTISGGVPDDWLVEQHVRT